MRSIVSRILAAHGADDLTSTQRRGARPFGWVVLFLLLLGLSSLACGLFGSDEQEAVEATPTTVAVSPTEAPPAPVPPTEAPPRPTAASASSDERPALAGLVSRLDDLDSYRASIRIDYEGRDEAGNDTSGSMTLEAMFVKDPPANSLVVNMEDAEEFAAGQLLQMVRIEDTVYTAMGGFGCFSGGSEEFGDISEPFDDLLNPQEDLLSDIKDVDFVGEETRNGYRSDCYAFDENDVETTMSDMDTLDGLVCISKEFGHVSYLRIDGEGSGTSDLFGGQGFAGTGTLVLEYNISDINEPLEITIPAECEDTGANSVWPILEDAADLGQFQGLVTYRTATPFDDILSFYEEEMGKLGFSVEGEPLILAGSTAIISYSDGTQTVSLTVSEDSSGEGFQILIAPEE